MGHPMTEEQDRAVFNVLAEVAAERKRQHAKWGEQNHNDYHMQVGDNFDTPESAQALVERLAKAGRLTYDAILWEVETIDRRANVVHLKRVEKPLNPATGVCHACRAGNHGSHRPDLAGICIGCACPEGNR